jgi:hypothetical protein
MLWLLDFRLVEREPADFVLTPLGLTIVGAVDFLPVIDLARVDLTPVPMLPMLPMLMDFARVDLRLVFFALVDFGRVILPVVLPIVLLAVFPADFPLVFLEADDMERPFRMRILVPPPLPLIVCIASQSLPISLAL